MEYIFKMDEGEYWWGGTAEHGSFSPFGHDTEIKADFRVECPNQTMPMFLSNKGRCIWSEEPFGIEVRDGMFILDGNDITIENFGSNLRDAYRSAQAKYFPPEGDELPEEFFRTPQYNTWMQYTYNPTQEGVLKYAHDIIDHGFKPGILIIDEGWQKEYGTWEFDPLKFENPKKVYRENKLLLLYAKMLVSCCNFKGMHYRRILNSCK